MVFVAAGPFAGQTVEVRKLISAKAVGVALGGRWRGFVTMPIAYLAKAA
jgi:hypothetical protein